MSNSNPQMSDIASLVNGQQDRPITFVAAFSHPSNNNNNGGEIVSLIDHMLSEFNGCSARSVANSVAREFCISNDIDPCYLSDVRVYTCTLM